MRDRVSQSLTSEKSLTTLAKSVANGAPIGILGGRADVMDLFKTRADGRVMFAGTFNGHPYALGAALATIEVLERDGGAVHRHLYELGEMMRNGLAEIVRDTDLPAEPVSFGSVFVCYFTGRPVRSFDDALHNDADLYVRFHRGMIDKGFLMFPSNLKRSHLMAAHTRHDVTLALEAASSVLVSLDALG